MLYAVAGQITASRKSPSIREFRIGPFKLGHHQGIEIYEMGVGAARKVIIYAMRVMAGGACASCCQMAAVTASSGSACSEAVVVQDAGPVMAAIAEAVILKAFRGVLKYLIAPFQYGSE